MNTFMFRKPEEIQRFWRRITDIEAYIESISDLGEMKIAFSRNITIQNITNVNSTVLEVEMIPHLKHTNLTKLVFSYNCTQFNPDYILLQLNFDDPKYISY